MGLPQIDIIFKQLAVSAIARSKRGIAVFVLRDDTAGEEITTKKTYLYEEEIDKSLYTAENLRIIKRAWLVAVNKIIVITIPVAADFGVATKILAKTKFNYVCTTAGKDQQELANWVVNKNNKTAGKKIIGLVSGVAVADSKFIINVKNEKLKELVYSEEKEGYVAEEITALSYLPRLCSLLANLPMNRSCTYYVLEDLEEVDEIETDEISVDDLIDKGWFVLINDEDEVRIGRGVNSLTTFTSSDSEDMSSILIMESLNLILEDIYNTFKKDYIGHYKNYYDNQTLFIAAINGYFKALEEEEILDPNYTGNEKLKTTGNQAYIDVNNQRNAWISVGKTEAKDWSDEKVREMTFKKKMFLAGNIKVLDAIEDLKFVITME